MPKRKCESNTKMDRIGTVCVFVCGLDPFGSEYGSVAWSCELIMKLRVRQKPGSLLSN